ncbi:hypothetical protein RUM43_006917 [Polyplax serrata]
MADIILTGVDDKVLITICCGLVLFLIAGFLAISRYQNASPNRGRSVNVNDSDHHSFNNDVCPICLGSQRLAVETNCGHKFCGSCLKNYLNRTPGNFSLFSNPAQCPMCRQDVNILLLCFTSEDTMSIDSDDERRAVESLVHEYNIRFGQGPRTWMSYISDCPVLIRHMFFDFFTFGGLVWMFRLRVLLCCFGAIVYLFNPLDIIPEAMFGIFGFLDDVIVFVLCVIYVSIIYRHAILRRATSNS